MSVFERFRRPHIEEHEEVVSREAEPVKPPRHFNWRQLVNIPFLASLAVVLIVAGILIGRSIHHHDLKQKTGTITAASVKGEGTGSSTPSSTKSSTTQKSTSGSTASGSTVQQPTQLANTGPGDVLAIFLLTSLAAGGAHAVVRSRR